MRRKNKRAARILTFLLAFMMVFTGMNIGSWNVNEAWAASTDAGYISISVKSTDDDGIAYTPSTNASTDGVKENYEVKILPGVSVPSTVPDPTVSSTTYKYTWDKLVITIKTATGATISNFEWDANNPNVAKFTITAEDGTTTQDYTITLTEADFGTDESNQPLTAQDIIDKVRACQFEMTMDQTYTEVKEWFENNGAGKVGLSDDFKLTLTTNPYYFFHNAKAGTKDDPDGTDYTDTTNTARVSYENVAIGSSSGYKITILDKAIPYKDENEFKAIVKTVADGGGTASAEYVDNQYNNKNYGSTTGWYSIWNLKAVPKDGYRFVSWVQTAGDAADDLTVAGKTNREIKALAYGDFTYTAYFVKNNAPTVKTAPTELKTSARSSYTYNFKNIFEDKNTVTVGTQTYSSVNDPMTFSATMDGKALSKDVFTTNGTFTYTFAEAGTHELVVTATDDLGASTSFTVPLTVTANPSSYKINLTATLDGKPVSLTGENGLGAEMEYYGGARANYELDGLDNEYYDHTNIYKIIIANWEDDIAGKYNLTELKAGKVTITGELPTTTAKARCDIFGDGTTTDMIWVTGGELVIQINKTSTLQLTEDLNIELNFTEELPTYTPVVTVSEAGGGTIPNDGLFFVKNTDEGSQWKLTAEPGTGYALDYIQIGEDTDTKVTCSDEKTITWTVTAADQEYTAYFKKLPVASFTDKLHMGSSTGENFLKGAYPFYTESSGEKAVAFNTHATFEYLSSDQNYPVDLANESEKNTLLYGEQVALVTEVDLNNTLPAGTNVDVVYYAGDSTGGNVLAKATGSLASEAAVHDSYGVALSFILPEGLTQITAVMTFNAGKTDEFTMQKTYALGDTGITFRSPVESDYVKAAVMVNGYIEPTMVKEFKIYSGFEFLLAAYEKALQENSAYKSIVVDVAGSAVNTIYFSTEEPQHDGTPYTFKQHNGGKLWSWAQYTVNNFYCDLGTFSWKLYGDETIIWGGLNGGGYSTTHSLKLNAADTWAVAVLRQYYSDDALVTAGVGTTYTTAEQLAQLYPNHKDEILNRNTVPTAAKEAFVPVVEKINAIGTVDANSATAIRDAREAYDALPKTFFGSSGYFPYLFKTYEPYKEAYDKLIAAEEAYAALGGADETTASYTAALSGVTNYISTNVTAPAVDSIGGEWAVFALARYDALPAATKNAYLSALDKALANGELTSKTDYERVTLALTSLGIDATSYGANEEDLTKAFRTYDANMLFNAKIFALLALNAKPYTEKNDENVQKYVDDIVGAALSGGGWNLTGTGAADVDTTAMAIQALAPFYSDSEVKTVVDNALTWLKTQQNSSGGFAAYGGTPENSTESNAQVVVALCELGINPAGSDWTNEKGGNPLTALLKNYNMDKKFFGSANKNSVNQMATEQAAYALVAYDRMLSGGKTSLYDMSDVSEQTDAEKLAEVEAAIDAITEPVTLEQKDVINTAADLYNRLTDELKDQVNDDKEKKLKDAMAALSELEIANVESLIDAIGEVTLDKEDEITEANAAYNSLTAAQKEKVSNYETLQQALIKLEALKMAQEKEQNSMKPAAAGTTKSVTKSANVKLGETSEAAKAVIEQIKAIINATGDEKLPEDAEDYTEEQKQAIINAYKAYNALTAEEQLAVEKDESYKAFAEILAKLGDVNHYDEPTGTDVRDNTDDVMPWHIKLVVKPQEMSKEQQEDVTAALGEESEMFTTNDIYFINVLDGSNWHPQEAVKVEMPMVDIGDYTSAIVVHISDDGDIELIEGEVVDKNIEFYAYSFSIYGIAGTMESMDDLMGTGGSVWPWIVIGILALAAIGYLIYRRKKGQGEDDFDIAA